MASANKTPSVMVSVEVDGRTSYKNVKGSSTRTKTQSRTLGIEVSTLAKEEISGVKVKWKVFSHSLKDRSLVELDGGESTVKIPAFGKKEITSKEVKVTGTREHIVNTQSRRGGQGGGGGGRARVQSKKVAASGEDYHGYAVEVYVGGELVATKYSHPALERELQGEKKSGLR